MKSRTGESFRFYADGAASNNGRRNCTAAYGVYAPQLSPSRYNGAVRTQASNQRAELVAIQRALELMQENAISHGIIVTDSAYAMNCLTKWHKQWEKNAFHTQNGKPVKHADVIRDCLERLQKLHVRFQHVRSHQPDPGTAHDGWQDWDGNREADRLAGLAQHGQPAQGGSRG